MPGEPHYDADLAGEIRRMQSAYTPRPSNSRLQVTNGQLNIACPKPSEPTGPEIAEGGTVLTYVWLDYNDAGQVMPSQGETNEMFAGNLIDALSQFERKCLHLCYMWLRTKTILFISRIKLFIADGYIGIQRLGNQDTQSCCHSQGINIMIDSEEMCRNWRERSESNQHVARYGKAGLNDGVWRDKNGKEAEGNMGKPGKEMGWTKDTVGVVKKLQDKGGF